MTEELDVILLGNQYLGDSTATVEPFYIDRPPKPLPEAEYGGEYIRYQLAETCISPRILHGRTIR